MNEICGKSKIIVSERIKMFVYQNLLSKGRDIFHIINKKYYDKKLLIFLINQRY